MNPENPGSVAYEAAAAAEEERRKLLEQQCSFCAETVFSHPSKIELIRQAKKRGYDVRLVFIHVANVEINKARVLYRVADGGHEVPEQKIVERHPRTMSNILAALPLADETYVFDNTSAAEPHRFILRFKEGGLLEKSKQVPNWAKTLFSLEDT